MVNRSKTADVHGTDTESMHSQAADTPIHTRKQMCVATSLITGVFIVSTFVIFVKLALIKNKPMSATMEIPDTEISTMTTSILVTETHASTISTTRMQVNDKTTWKHDGITVAGGNRVGSQLDQLSVARGFAIDDDSTIYIADGNNHRIVRWAQHAKFGEVVAGGNGAGNRIDQLDNPSDVLIDRINVSLVICDWGNGRLIRAFHHDPERQAIVILKTGCNRLVFDRNGDLYITDNGYHSVKRWKEGESDVSLVAGGNERGSSLNQFNSPMHLVVNEDHSLYIADMYNNRVMKWNKDATEGVVLVDEHAMRRNVTQAFTPTGLIVDCFNNLYVADNNNDQIVRFSVESRKSTVIVGRHGSVGDVRGLYRSEEIAFDREGNLYVLDSFNYRVQKFDVQLSNDL